MFEMPIGYPNGDGMKTVDLKTPEFTGEVWARDTNLEAIAAYMVL